MKSLRSGIFVVILLTAGCATTPPNLTPAASLAFTNTRVIKGLDLLRDTAIDAQAQTPPLLSEATTRKVVEYHESALKTIHAVSSGWQATVAIGLEETVKNLPAAEQQVLAPYVALVQALIGVAN